jgi:hypothetical protein
MTDFPAKSNQPIDVILVVAGLIKMERIYGRNGWMVFLE